MIKKSYVIKKFEEEGINWDLVPALNVHNLLWDKNGYAPVSMSRICYTDTRIHVKHTSYETEVRKEALELNDPVCKDSCMEFFFQINPETDPRYLNFETNCIGTLLLGIGEKRGNRTLLQFDFRKVLEMKSTLTGENSDSYKGPCWSVEYTIPFSFLEEYYGRLDIRSGKKIAANVFKCGDETRYPHYMSWNFVESDTPDFHRPQDFGEMIFE